jgi:puromycin-sensitive aminopeptidase
MTRTKTDIFYYVSVSLIGLSIIILSIIGASHIHSTYTFTSACINNDANKDRLPPRPVIPLNYTLQLKPDLQTFVYNGTVEIVIQVLKQTKCFFLNYEEIDIQNVVVLRKDDSQVKISGLILDSNYTILQIKFDQYMELEQYKIRIQFSSNIRRDLRGFYRSYYIKNNVTKNLFVTQFESQDARTAFPCFDEPDLKATFDIEFIIRQQDLAIMPKFVALSNMPESNRAVLPDGSLSIHFLPTKPMSTYLVAWVLGEFDYVGLTSDGIDYRVFTLPGESDTARFALVTAQQITEAFHRYFGIKYAFPKMDLIAIPDFRAGAMENWGLITFRATYLVVDNSTTSSQKEDVAEVIAHEIAHQWTGNLVTANWWDNLWLNEGFATFFETQSLDTIHPEWKRWEKKLTNTFQAALVVDASPTSHALVTNVQNQADIEAVFDTITYNKGAALLYMFYNYLGPSDFQKWISTYLRKYEFGNAITDNLLSVLAEIKPDDLNIKLQFSTWTYQPGYPLITLSKKEGDSTYTLSQKRFYSRPQDNAPDQKWWVPIRAKLPTGNHQTFTLDKASSPFTLSTDWIKLNAGQVGFYRVNYDTDLWLKLFDQLSTFSVEDRFGIIDDLFALTGAGEIKIALPFRALSAIKNSEQSLVLWETIISNLNSIVARVVREPVADDLSRVILNIIGPIRNKLGWDIKPGESDEDTQLRPIIILTSLMNGNNDDISYATTLYWSGNNIPVELRQAVYYTIVRHGGEKAYMSILGRYMDALNGGSDFERSRCMAALAQASKPSLVKRTLEFALSNNVRSQDAGSLIRLVARNPYGIDIAWDFIKQNYESIRNKIGDRTFQSYIVGGVCNLFATIDKYNEVKNTFELTAPGMALNQSLEAILANKFWLDKNYQDLVNYLRTA